MHPPDFEDGGQTAAGQIDISGREMVSILIAEINKEKGCDNE